MKGNDGRAARRRSIKRILVGISTVFLVLLVRYIITTTQKETTTKLSMLRNGAKDSVNKAREFRKELEHSYANEHDEGQLLQQILEAKIHLVDLEVVEEELMQAHPSTYAGVYGHFCQLNFAAHKKDPSAVPMFRDIVHHSPDCKENGNFKVDLRKIVELARHQDATSDSVKVLNLTAVAFHESRCGSTLVANSFIAMDPTKHRTYSESAPGAQALRNVCGESFRRCSMEQAAKLLQDTVYMMSRTNDLQEERVFYKFQSITTKSIQVFQAAFPQVPWLFVYRDPVQVMMSHIKDDPTMSHAICTRTKQNPPPDINQIAQRHHLSNAKHFSKEEYCAAHLAGITEAAVRRLNDYAIPVNYDGLMDTLMDEIFPRIWGRPLSTMELDNIKTISQTYSKGRGDRHKEFKGDSEAKNKAASTAVKEAAELILKQSYDSLETFTSKFMEQPLPQ